MSQRLDLDETDGVRGSSENAVINIRSPTLPVFGLLHASYLLSAYLGGQLRLKSS